VSGVADRLGTSVISFTVSASRKVRSGRAGGRGPDDDSAPCPLPRIASSERQAKCIDPGALQVPAISSSTFPGRLTLVEYENIDVAEIGSDISEGRVNRGLVGDIAGVGFGAREFVRKLAREFGAPGQERDGVAVRGEAPGESLAIARADANHRAHRSF
jgi:hypothetical protein